MLFACSGYIALDVMDCGSEQIEKCTEHYISLYNPSGERAVVTDVSIMRTCKCVIVQRNYRTIESIPIELEEEISEDEFRKITERMKVSKQLWELSKLVHKEWCSKRDFEESSLEWEHVDSPIKETDDPFIVVKINNSQMDEFWFMPDYYSHTGEYKYVKRPDLEYDPFYKRIKKMIPLLEQE